MGIQEGQSCGGHGCEVLSGARLGVCKMGFTVVISVSVSVHPCQSLTSQDVAKHRLSGSISSRCAFQEEIGGLSKL